MTSLGSVYPEVPVQQFGVGVGLWHLSGRLKSWFLSGVCLPRSCPLSTCRDPLCLGAGHKPELLLVVSSL